MVSTTLGWVSVDEAAKFYSVSPKTIRRRIADGTLTTQRFGPRLLRVWIDAADMGGAK